MNSPPYLVHEDDVPVRRRDVGEMAGAWTDLGRASGSVGVGLRRISVDPGARSTPVHVHGASEEIFFVLGGDGLSWQDGDVHEIRAGDGLVHHAAGAAHTLRAGPNGLDVLAFGTRAWVEALELPAPDRGTIEPTLLHGHPARRVCSRG